MVYAGHKYIYKDSRRHMFSMAFYVLYVIEKLYKPLVALGFSFGFPLPFLLFFLFSALFNRSLIAGWLSVGVTRACVMSASKSPPISLSFSHYHRNSPTTSRRNNGTFFFSGTLLSRCRLVVAIQRIPNRLYIYFWFVQRLYKIHTHI